MCTTTWRQASVGKTECRRPGSTRSQVPHQVSGLSDRERDREDEMEREREKEGERGRERARESDNTHIIKPLLPNG